MKASLQPDNDHLASARHEFNMHPDHKPYDWDAGGPFDDLPRREPNHYVPVDSMMLAFHRGMIAGAVIEAVLIIASIALFYALF